ncbi:hypothetical protein MHK_001757 [Candidatus Magnetomorum sp. HK-1]|nr:hypothetical protein MHK_001757 [Candidatus Magnetomorum sp. HK-1]
MNIFISYSHEDISWKERIIKQLKILEAAGFIKIFEDSQIEIGQDWSNIIEYFLKKANLALLLISSDFLKSKFIKNVEIPKILEGRKNGNIEVYPIILKDCTWKEFEWLSKIQVFPKNGEPLSGKNENEIDSNITQLIESIVKFKNYLYKSLYKENVQIAIKDSQSRNIQRRTFTIAIIGGIIGKMITYISIPLFELNQITDLFLKNDICSLKNINDLKKWAMEQKNIEIQANGKRDIYQGLLFPLFQMKEVKEIKFNSTSLFWGHASFRDSYGSEYISRKSFNYIQKSFFHGTKIDIINTTPDIDTLLRQYGSSLYEIINEYDKLFSKTSNKIRYGKKCYKDNYCIYVKIAVAIGFEFYKIVFLNSSLDDHIIKFDGRIRVYSLNEKQYKQAVNIFEKELLKADTYKNILNH